MTFLMMVLTAVAIMILWFIMVILIAKCTVGKKAKTWQIFTFLFLAGPVGWGVVCVMAMLELIDKCHTGWHKVFPGKLEENNDE